MQLLRLHCCVLADRGWSGWVITPPRTHPFRYLACREFPEFEKSIALLGSMWTYHEDAALVMEDYLIEDIKEGWRTRMTRVDGILFCHWATLTEGGLETRSRLCLLVNSEMHSEIVYHSLLCVYLPTAQGHLDYEDYVRSVLNLSRGPWSSIQPS